MLAEGLEHHLFLGRVLDKLKDASMTTLVVLSVIDIGLLIAAWRATSYIVGSNWPGSPPHLEECARARPDRSCTTQS